MENIIIGNKTITVEEIGEIAGKVKTPALSSDPIFVERIKKGPLLVEKLLKERHVIYGVNTGVGENCGAFVTPELTAVLPSHVIRFHGCALGRFFTEEETRAIMTARLISLARGNSGVRLELLAQLTALLRHDVLPRIPQEGSVGASGDLSHLSYIGAVISGHRDVLYHGQVMPADAALAKVGLKPLVLENKEALGILNGTSAMTGVACLAWIRANRISQLTTKITSLAIVVLKGNRFHYDEALFSVKPHPGQLRVAQRIRSDLNIVSAPQDYSKSGKIQDRYSLRCAPQIIGVLEDFLPFAKTIIETELNSTNDNPIIDVDSDRIFHGGHFYGGHIAMTMDTLKCQVANMADLLDRQMASLVDTNYNNGLPSDLSGAKGDRKAINHGLKGLQITCSGWTAEALKNTMPASVFSRSTECHNQDKVSMGTIAARDCIRVLDLVEQVVAALIVALRQAIEFREMEGEEFDISKNATDFVNLVKAKVNFFEDDVFLEPVLRKVLDMIGNMDHLY
ncbi:histidine ammonia-lyase [Folsomia candida]|uniref:histidine ammonia-lyase n=1 Tax=Folsomia candida TaxID=158441 RepID=UPI000B8F13D1|nr:histidine ammonia-lyase [Folsomia candida]